MHDKAIIVGDLHLGAGMQLDAWPLGARLIAGFGDQIKLLDYVFRSRN